MKAPLEPEKDFGVSASRGGISRLSHSMLSSPSPPPESSSLSSSSFSLISMIFLTKYWIVRGSVCVGNLSEPDAAHSGRSPSQVHPWYCWVSTHKGRSPRKNTLSFVHCPNWREGGWPKSILTSFQKWKSCPNNVLQGVESWGPSCPNWHFLF